MNMKSSVPLGSRQTLLHQVIETVSPKNLVLPLLKADRGR